MRWVVLLCACTSSPPGAARESFTVTRQTCVYDLEAPARLAGSLPTYFTPGVDCVPPEGGELFTVGFGWPGGVLRLAAPRPLQRTASLGEVGLYLRNGDEWCVDWQGEAVMDDLPEWSLFIDGHCGALRVVGRIALK